MGRVISHDLEIARVAARQHGNITRRQLRSIGLTDDAIAHRVRTGRLFRQYPGVYSVGRPAVTALEKASAAVLACGTGAALSHSSAMTLWGFYKYWETPFHVVVPGDRRPKGITVHRSATLTWRDLKTHRGIRVTSPARTIFDMAPRMKRKTLTRVVNDALRGPLPEDTLAEIVARLPNAKAAKLLRPFVENDNGLTYSELEDEFAAFCEEFGLPRPLTNVRIAGYLRDAWFPQERVVVELDGWDFHKSRHSFESDRERDAEALLAGIVTVRITHERMKHARANEAARLDKILEARRRELSRASVPGRGSLPRT
jgi:hypothetical protein